LSKAVEIWVEEKVARPLVGIEWLAELFKDRRGHQISPEKATLGDITKFLKEVVDKIYQDPKVWYVLNRRFSEITPDKIAGFKNDLREIKDKFRNGWAPKKIMKRNTYEKFRELSPNFFKTWIPKWKA